MKEGNLQTMTPLERDRLSLETGTLNDEPSMTRQEFKKDADINEILRKFNVGDLSARQATFGETDFTADLQQALESIRETEAAWHRLPQSLKDKYPTWGYVLEALHNGELNPDLSFKQDTPAPPSPTPPTPPTP